MVHRLFNGTSTYPHVDRNILKNLIVEKVTRYLQSNRSRIFDRVKVNFDQRMNFLRSLFAQERQSLSTKSRSAQLQLKAEEQEFQQSINAVQKENKRLISVRRDKMTKGKHWKKKQFDRMLNEKHDHNFSIDLNGTKRTSSGTDFVQQDRPNLVALSPLDLEPETVQRKPPGASKYDE